MDPYTTQVTSPLTVTSHSAKSFCLHYYLLFTLYIQEPFLNSHKSFKAIGFDTNIWGPWGWGFGGEVKECSQIIQLLLKTSRVGDSSLFHLTCLTARVHRYL